MRVILLGLNRNADIWFAELGLTELKTRAFEAGAFNFAWSFPFP
jgi:hypothetical protein